MFQDVLWTIDVEVDWAGCLAPLLDFAPPRPFLHPHNELYFNFGGMPAGASLGLAVEASLHTDRGRVRLVKIEVGFAKGSLSGCDAGKGAELIGHC